MTWSGEPRRGQLAPADRTHLAAWLRRFDGLADTTFAVEACTGWRYVVEELRRAGVAVQLAEPADTAAARGRKKRAKTDRADSRLLRGLVCDGRVPQSWIPPMPAILIPLVSENAHTTISEARPEAHGRDRSRRSSGH
jgi:transposase